MKSLMKVAVVAGAALIGCAGQPDDGAQQASSPSGGVAERKVAADENLPAGGAVKARCEVGSRPGYLLPAEYPPVIFGCARLKGSGKTVELSANGKPIGGRDYICINPAHRGRGHAGFYVPTVCTPGPVPDRVAVVDAEVPSQGIRGYGFVVWGTAGATVRSVVAEHLGGRAQAAVFSVDAPLTRRIDATRPFGVFILELPAEAACEDIIVRSIEAGDATTARLDAADSRCDRALRAR